MLTVQIDPMITTTINHKLVITVNGSSIFLDLV